MIRAYGLLVLLWGGRAHANEPWAPHASVLEDYADAHTALQANAPEAAERLLIPILALDPDCGVCRHAMAVALIRQGRIDEALAQLEQLRLQHPDRAAPFATTAAAELALNQPVRAIETARTAILLDPVDFSAWQILLQLLVFREDLDGVRRLIAQSSEAPLSETEQACLTVEAQIAWGDLVGARRTLVDCAALKDEQLLDEMRLKLAQAEGDLETIAAQAFTLGLPTLRMKANAARALRAGDPATAIATLENALQLRPGDPDALLLRARAWRALGEPARAVQDVEQLMGQRPTVWPNRRGGLSALPDWPALRRQAAELNLILLVESGDVEAARAWLETGRARLGEGPALAAAEIRLLLAEGQQQAATDALQRARRRWPTDPRLGHVALDLPGQLTEETAAWVRTLPDPSPAIQLALRRHRLGDNLECQVILDDRTEPDALQLAHQCAIADDDQIAADQWLIRMRKAGAAIEPHAGLRHAWLLADIGQTEASLAILRDITPPDALADHHRSLMVWALTELSQTDRALAVYQSGPVSPEQQANLAYALYADGQRRRARAMLAEACARMTRTTPQARQCRDAKQKMP
ncbi:MAG: tetratricopeptide repeat protein [Myxococcota bacterium]